jgi:hypothetical protein
MAMDIRALVLVRTATEILEDSRPISPLPTALLEVVGKSPLQRTLDRLHRFGVQQVTVISDSILPSNPGDDRRDGTYLRSSREKFWRVAEAAFSDMAQEGAELVLLIALGGYAEVDFEKLIQAHLDRQARVSQIFFENRPVEIFCISASRRNDAASLLRSRLVRCRIEYPLFEHNGYFNPLNGGRDLRQFAIDILTLRTETPPSGVQVRPGVWMERGARLEKGARVLAPAFVGAFAKLRAHVVVTRCSSVEHHSQVDLGTVIENSTILPHCRIGAGLDVAHCVVGGDVLANLRRDVTVEIVDSQLIGHAVTGTVERLATSAAEFLSYLPKQAWRGVFGKTASRQPDIQAALRQTSPALGGAAGYEAPACDTGAAEKFSSSLAVVRRYGHQ